MLLYRTVTGSRLYGLDHTDSDFDTIEVYANKVPSPSKWIKQSIKGKEDVTRMNLSTFMLYANRSSHQILEAMYSRQAEVDFIEELRSSYVINTNTFVSLYNRTIRNFVMQNTRKGKMHACRLHFNLQDGLENGRFEPEVTGKRKDWLLNSETIEFDRFLEEYLDEYASLLA